MIGLFRRESFGSQSQHGGVIEAGSDPTLAGQLSIEMQSVAPASASSSAAAVQRTPKGGRAASDRRSVSLCGPSCIVVLPISETSELIYYNDDDEDDEDDVDGDASPMTELTNLKSSSNMGDSHNDDLDPLGALSRTIGDRVGDRRSGVIDADVSRLGAAAAASPFIGGRTRGNQVSAGNATAGTAAATAHHNSPFAVTGSHRSRNYRRGSMLELNE